MACSQNCGPLLAIRYITAPDIGAPKGNPNLGTTYILRIYPNVSTWFGHSHDAHVHSDMGRSLRDGSSIGVSLRRNLSGRHRRFLELAVGFEGSP